MKAHWYSRNGAARDVLVAGEIDTPVAAAGEVLVRLHTSGINPSDVKSRQARPVEGPLIVPHSDGAGVIVGVGAGVATARIGERVWIWNGQWKRPMGTAAQYIAIAQDQAVPLPDGVSFEVGACIGIPLLTALQAVRLAGDLQGRTVLVTGGGGAVGHYVTQLACLAGSTVLATAGSPARRAHASQAGAAQVIDYKNDDVIQSVHGVTGGAGVDAIIDLDFSSTAPMLARGLLKPHGTFVCYGSNQRGDLPVDIRSLLWGSLQLRFFLVYDLLPQDREAVVTLATELLRTDRLTHSIGAVLPLGDIATAHQLVEDGRTIGNVVLDILT